MFSLQDAVESFSKDITRWLSDANILLKLPKDSDREDPGWVTPKVYKGGLPIRISGLDEVSFANFYPAIVVKLSGGEVHSEDAWTSMQIDVGTWDNDASMSGYSDVLTLVQFLYEKILAENIIHKTYRARLPVKYTVEPPEKTFPFFEACITLGIDFPAVWPRGISLGGDALYPFANVRSVDDQ